MGFHWWEIVHCQKAISLKLKQDKSDEMYSCQYFIVYLWPCFYSAYSLNITPHICWFITLSTAMCTQSITSFKIHCTCIVLCCWGIALYYKPVLIVSEWDCPPQQPLGVKRKLKTHLSQAHRLPSVGLQTEVQMKQGWTDCVHAAASQNKHFMFFHEASIFIPHICFLFLELQPSHFPWMKTLRKTTRDYHYQSIYQWKWI